MILNRDILLLSLLPKGGHCTECQRSNQQLQSAGSHPSTILFQNLLPKPLPPCPHWACQLVQIYGIPLSGGCTVFWFHPPPFLPPQTVPPSCTKPHVLIWQTKHQEWGNQTAQEILQASSLDKYFQLTLQQGPSSLWSWLCNQKPRCRPGRFCVVVLCCMQSGGRDASPGERTQWEDHKTGMCVRVSGLALTFSGCHLSRQANGIQVPCSPGTSGNADGTQEPQHRDVPVVSCSEQTVCLSPAFLGQFYVHSAWTTQALNHLSDLKC